MRPALLIVLLSLLVPATAGAATRYASPAGTGNCLTRATPCSLETAMGGAVAGDEVTVLAGTYTGGGKYESVGGVTIAGDVIGPRRPVLGGDLQVNPGSFARDLEIRGQLSLADGAAADRILAVSSEADPCSLQGTSTLRNSVCNNIRTSGAAGVSMYGPSSLTGVTSAGGGVGINTFTTVDIRNTAFSAAEADLVIYGGRPFADHVAFTNGDISGSATVTARVDPLVSASATDLRPAAGSPTIDAGDDGQPQVGELDLNGNFRKLGSAVDIGAYERVTTAPTVGTVTLVGSTATTAEVAVTDVAGFGAHADVAVEHGIGALDRVAASSAPASLTAQDATVAVTGLIPDSTYTYRVTVTTDGGSVSTGTATFETDERAPVVTTGAATAITATGATIAGVVDSAGGAATSRFEVDGVDLAAQEGTGGTLTTALTGLEPNTTYEYRLKATTTGGGDGGELRSFKTLPLAPTATLADATEVTQTGARLTGTADTKGVSGTIRFLLDGVLQPAQTGETGSYAQAVAGLKPGSTHTYALRVTTTGGTVTTTERSFTTATPTVAPVVTPTPTVPGPAVPSGPGPAVQPTAPPAFTPALRRRGTARVKAVTATVGCGATACTAKARGELRIGKRRIGRLTAPRRALALQAGRSGRITLKAGKRLQRQVRTALAKRRTARAVLVVRVRFTAADGRTASRTLRVRVRR